MAADDRAPRPPVIFISHTTQDARDFTLAHRLATGLQARGATVWIAPESVPPGSDWKEALVEAILERCTHFLVIVSAGAAQAPWVIREVELAIERRHRDPAFTILPLIVGQTAGSRTMERLGQWQRVPYLDDSQAQIEAVARLLELKPVVASQFASFIAEKTDGFLGRGYVFEAIDAFLARPDRRGYFTIEGDPGVGKSAIVAEFVRRTGCIAHFNVRSLGITSAGQFLESVCGQLIARFDLPYSSLPPGATQSGEFLARLLNEAGAHIAEQQRLVIAIDALDEVEPQEPAPGANILFLPPLLPAGVFIVMSRRKQRIPLVLQVPEESFDLTEAVDQTAGDIEEYLQRALRTTRIQGWLRTTGTPEETFTRTLQVKSENNFMYLRYVLSAIGRGLYKDLALAELPRGLEGYYDDHWRRMGMAAKPLREDRIQIVYVLAEVRQPVSAQLIAAVTGHSPLSIQEVLDDWDQFLRRERTSYEARYSVYHASFREFLHRKDIVKMAGVTLPDIHALIGKRLWSNVFDADLPSGS